MDAQQLVETWQINNRVNLYLLDAVAPEHLDSKLLSKGRSVAENFAHIHNVRLMWLKASQPELSGGLTKIENENAGDKTLLQKSLNESAEAIAGLLQKSVGQGGKVKGFKPHVSAFLGYLTAHEAHHRSQIILALKQSGHPLEKKILFGIWEWGVR
ncbi:MAG TPA: DinB family protein [Pyrinomonadaceae bacterium]|jgi:uncharacterized damage-inducible protein DinB